MADDLNAVNPSPGDDPLDTSGTSIDPTKPARAATQSATTDPGKPDPTKPAPRVLTGAEWSAAQSAPASALLADDPGKATTNALGRPLTGDEWSKAQRMSASQLKQWKIPALPMPTARADATRQMNPNAPQSPGVRQGYFDELATQALGSVVDHPAQSAAMVGAAATGPLAALAVGTYLTGSMLATAAEYGYQKFLEVHAPPEVRKEMEADPERISGAMVAAQATLLGIGSLVHVGVKGVRAATDIGDGMTEAGASGVKETNFAPRFSEGFQDAADRSRFAANLERGAAEATPAAAAGTKPVAGLEPTALPAGKRGVSAKPVEGLEVASAAKPGKVTPLETQPANAPLQDAGEINAAVRDYQAQRVGEDTQDLAEQRQADAERLLGLREEDAARVEQQQAGIVRRRPQGQKANGPTPYFESPQGAGLLGSMAARKGLPGDASPYPPTSPLDAAWKAGHNAVMSDAAAAPETPAEAAPSYPEGFSMGGALTDNRIPASSELPKRARGADGPAAALADIPNVPNVPNVARGANGETGVPATKLRTGQTLSDNPRYDSGARRPLHLVSVKGLVKELVDLEDKRADAAERAQYNWVQDENFHSTEDGRSVPVATRGPGHGVSMQAKALQNLEDYARIDQEVTHHLVTQRGLPPDLVDDLLDRERAARFDRAGAEAANDRGDASFDFGHGQEPAAPAESPVGEERRSLERAAYTDDLTGLGNQRAYAKALPAAEADPETKVIRFDVNGMKTTNDVLGHREGDALLKRVGEAIHAQAPGLPSFRLGGDEFAVFAPADQAEAIRDAIEGRVGYGEAQGTHIKTGESAVARQSISGGVGDTDAEADANAYTRKEQHKAEQGFPTLPGRDAPAPGGPSRGLSAVEGTGETRTRGLSQGVANKALENRLQMEVGNLPEYRRVSMAEQSAAATKLLHDDPDLALRVARGEANAPGTLLPESVFVAVEQRATEQGDVATLRDLATSRLTSEATTMGQRIRALAERDPESPVAAIQDVVNTRSGGAENRAAVERATNDEVDAIAKHVDAVPVHGNAWNHLIDSLRC